MEAGMNTVQFSYFGFLISWWRCDYITLHIVKVFLV